MDTISTSALSYVAGLFEYPSAALDQELSRGGTVLSHYPKAQASVEALLGELRGLSLKERQELFSRTFELTSAHTLDTSNHLYDGYNRTQCLSKLAAMYSACGFRSSHQERGELPDYLPTVLEFVGRLGPDSASDDSSQLSEEKELKVDICQNYLRPALGRLRESFHETDAPYRLLIDVAIHAVEEELKGAR